MEELDQFIDLYDNGQKALENDDFQEAELIFKRILTESPNNHDAQYGLGLTFYYQNRYEETIACFRKLIKHYSLTYDIAQILSSSYSAIGNHAYAKRFLSKYLKKYEVADVIRCLGDIYRHQNDHSHAIQYYRFAIVLDHRSKEAYNNLAISLNTIGEYKEASVICRTAHRRWPDDVDIMVNYVASLYELKFFQKAKDTINQILLHDPTNVTAYTYLGFIYDDQERYDQAIEAFQKAINIAPNNSEAHIGLGITYDHIGEYSNGVSEFRKVIDLDPNDADAHNNLGVALEKLGDLNGANDEYNIALKIASKQKLPK